MVFKQMFILMKEYVLDGFLALGKMQKPLLQQIKFHVRLWKCIEFNEDGTFVFLNGIHFNVVKHYVAGVIDKETRSGKYSPHRGFGIFLFHFICWGSRFLTSAFLRDGDIAQVDILDGVSR